MVNAGDTLSATGPIAPVAGKFTSTVPVAPAAVGIAIVDVTGVEPA